MAPRPRPGVSTVPGNTADRPLLRFDVAAEQLAQRQLEFRGTPVPVSGGAGLNASTLFTAQEYAIIAADRTARAVINRVMRNAGKRAVDYIRKVSRPTYDTGTFYSNWFAKLEDSGGGLKAVLKLENPTPYALYVHRKGTRRDQTVYNKYVKPYIVKTLQKEIVEDITAALPRAVKAAILSARASR
jgi:hypothetical protein